VSNSLLVREETAVAVQPWWTPSTIFSTTTP